jgi:hypothetical protein
MYVCFLWQQSGIAEGGRIMNFKEQNIGTKMLRYGLPSNLGYVLYNFRMDFKLTEEEMLQLLNITMNSEWFKKEYGIKEEE